MGRGGQSDKSLPISLAARPSITHLRKEGREGGRGGRKWVGLISPACSLVVRGVMNSATSLAPSLPPPPSPPSIEVDRDRSIDRLFGTRNNRKLQHLAFAFVVRCWLGMQKGCFVISPAPVHHLVKIPPSIRPRP